MVILVTGSGGLIGSEAVRYFCDKQHTVYGIDNDLRSMFFGKDSSVQWNIEQLKKNYPDTFTHVSMDIRDESALKVLFGKTTFDLIIHCAAQPSHDWAAKDPVVDFDINARSTLLLLENYRKYCPKATFIFMSTNKVYGDLPNTLPFIEQHTRYELPKDHRYYQGIDESMSIDTSKHSLMGASKLSADIYVQEYGRYFDLNTVVFRAGCLTGPSHAGAKLHGFLAYLVKCIKTGTPYTIMGYKGKQVRDNLHARDVVRAFDQVYQNPRSGEVYNLGGARSSNTSILEAIERIERITGKKANVLYTDKNRSGDHIWYISDISKFKRHYPGWSLTCGIKEILQDLCDNIRT